MRIFFPGIIPGEGYLLPLGSTQNTVAAYEPGGAVVAVVLSRTLSSV